MRPRQETENNVLIRKHAVREQARQLAKRVLADRNKVLALYYQVAGITPPLRTEQESVSALEDFCQLLIDYVAAGHFCLYDRITRCEERNVESAEMTRRIYPQIAYTTEVALKFNDKYGGKATCPMTHELRTDLSRLGQALAIRIDLEDRISEALCRGRKH